MSAETKLRADHLPESMEISKSLQEEIFSVQNKLQNAILEHQINVRRLKEDPNNPDILGQIQNIQVYIVSLGRCQKQIVQRLRREVEASKAENANGSKVSIPSLLGLNNNNHITNNNETKHETAANGFETKSSKEDYEEIVRNGDVHHSPPQDNNCPKRRPSSVETISGEDDIVEMSMDENSNEKEEMQQEASQVQEDSSEMQQEASQMQKKSSIIESPEQQNFLYTIGLITKSKCIELQNKRVERKRRSTANPHFVYSMLEQPSKRKRHSYLQSGNAPHTRQTTARMNGPSPPPNKTQPTKSISPPTQTITKALIPFQKSSTRPNILRNADSRIFGKSKIEDSQARSSASSAKSVQSIGNKAVHIPGLPASLTIERIGSDSIVCVSCRNPGSLTICKNCSSNYHVSCHIQSPAPPRICPKCAMDEEEDIEKDEEMEIKGQMEGENKLHRYKKNEKLVATAYASGIVGKAREDSEVYKTVGGLHKADTTQKKRTLSTVPIGINQLSASTILIPLTSTSVDKSEDDKFTSIANTEQRQDTVPRNPHNLKQHARSGITDVQVENQMSHSYQLPSSTTVQPEKHQSYLIVKKVTESTGRHDKSADGEAEDKSCSKVYNYQLPTGCTATLTSHFATNSLFYDRNVRKKQIKRTIPLHRITVSKLSNSLLPKPNDYQLDRATLNGRKPWAKLTRGKLCVNQPATRPATEILLSSYSDAESSGNEQLQYRPKSIGSAEESRAAASFDGRGKLTPRAGTLIHSLFPGHNKPYTITSRAREPRGFGPNDRDYPLLRQHLCGGEYELVPHEQSDGGKPEAQFQRRALTKFFEHVKLEEAHLPAPFRTKLAHQDEVDDNDEIVVQKGERDQRYDDAGAVTEAPLLTTSCDANRDRPADRFPWIVHDTVSRSSSEDNNAADRSLLHASDVASTHSDDLTDYEFARVNAQSSRMMTSRQSMECENDQPATSVSIKQRKDDGAPVATLHIAQSNLSELRNEVSVPDDKADTERQDLPSGRRSRSRSNSSGSSGSSGSGHSDTPEQAMSNTNNFTDDFEILAMGIVSPREKEEEHELAMAREIDVAATPPLARHS
ncbi:uncharacterized protein [Linepithema humile]|uniref:uncharacterized protein n=1 Tax=Linepithema humile TaxID=83485 RepID=UPI0006233DFE|nr:PREDICTED: uncharacterized protein LOC105675257 [Linepithema humile]